MTAPDTVTAFRVGRADGLAVGEGRAYQAGDRQIAVFRTRAGRLFALDAVCPHAGGPIADGLIDEAVVVCPLHQNTFELATGCSPSGQPALRSYRVHTDEAGHLVVEVPTEWMEDAR
jgi:nitrite reductase/ring-hydroxylating ferredoxin subunit